jgi:transposase-like protein
VEELLAERGVTVSHEAIRPWCLKFGHTFAKKLRHHRGRPGDTWHLDELFIRIRGERYYLWRTVEVETARTTVGSIAAIGDCPTHCAVCKWENAGRN